MANKIVLKMIHFSIIIKSMRHFLGSVMVRGSVKGLFFTRHLLCNDVLRLHLPGVHVNQYRGNKYIY